MTKLEEILTDVLQGTSDVGKAEIAIRILFSEMLDEAAIGISNVDATSLYGEMSRRIESA